MSLTKLNFIDELRWRGMLNDLTPGIEEELSHKSISGYIGFDPTAASLTIGNYVQIMILKLFQLSGHQPIVLMGGATGRIGDPSFKDKERELKTVEEIEANLNRQKDQMMKLLDFEVAENKALLVNNYDFYSNMNVLDFLRDVGKTLTVNYMMSKDSVKNRIDTGISFTEFSYQLLQGYDYQCLYTRHNCTLQMGGSDQWGNIMSGIEFIRRNINGKAHAVTTPLLLKSDGSKFGKSESGNIWLDAELTSPYKFYQFWLNVDDSDISKFTRYFSLKPREEIVALEKESESDPRILKKALAEELTARIHSDESLASVKKVSDLLFNTSFSTDDLKSLTVAELEMISGEIPFYEVTAAEQEIEIAELLAVHTKILSSKGDVRRAIQNNAISVNKNKISAPDHKVSMEDLLIGKYLLIENGKKNKNIVKFI